MLIAFFNKLSLFGRGALRAIGVHASNTINGLVESFLYVREPPMHFFVMYTSQQQHRSSMQTLSTDRAIQRSTEDEATHAPHIHGPRHEKTSSTATSP